MAIASWRCGKCKAITKIEKGSPDYTFRKRNGRDQPIHRGGCPKDQKRGSIVIRRQGERDGRRV